MDVSNLRFRVLAEPRGFIRFLQFILSIVAFATTSGFETMRGFILKCEGQDTQNIIFPVAYPFRIDEYAATFTTCDTNKNVSMVLEGDLSSSAQWFVTVGVFSFLLSLASIVFYVAYESSFRLSHERLVTIGDFVATVIFAFLWLTAASAWAWGTNQIKTLTDFDYVSKISPYSVQCQITGVNCRNQGSFQSSKLSASVAFGFLNLFLWISNVWFVYKESPFHPEPNKEMAQEPPAGAPPSGPPQNTM